MPDDAQQTILAALPGVEATQLVFSPDGSAVTVSLREDQLAGACRENGRYIREAAMATGVRIDVEMVKTSISGSWWKFWRKNAEPDARA
jgi:transcription antitermination factor NusA-like protein